MSENQKRLFPVGKNVKCKFGGFRFKEGETWKLIEVSYLHEGNPNAWSNTPFWMPTNETYTKPDGKIIDFGTVQEQQLKVFNKLLHLLEPFGVSKEEISTDGTFKEFFDLLEAKSNPFKGKEVYVKTMKITNKRGEEQVILGKWFPFSSATPNMEYSETEAEQMVANGVKETVIDDAFNSNVTTNPNVNKPNEDEIDQLPF